MNAGDTHRVRRLAVHSTHEAAEKIAGIGAVLDGILPQPDYREAFPGTVLAGPYPFPGGSHPLEEVLFDSEEEGSAESPLDREVVERLTAVARDFGTRVVFGRRRAGPRQSGVPVDVLLVNPCGIRRSKVEAFQHGIRETFNFGLTWYEDNYHAIEIGSDTSLDRLLKHYDALRQQEQPPPYPASPSPEVPLQDHRGKPFYGGVPFQGLSGDPRALFPDIRSLDSFSGFDKMNGYLIELQFYFFAAAPLWQATRALVETLYCPGEMTLFAHDWLGVPLVWSAWLDRSGEGGRVPASTVYFAHEARIARLLVEGTIKDKVEPLRTRCHPDGHDVSFYAYLCRLERATSPMSLDEAFPEVHGPYGGRAFDDIFYHAINRQASRFDRVVAVGENVKKETELILRGEERRPAVSLCPNGIPDFTAPAPKAEGGGAPSEEILEHKVKHQAEARERIVAFSRARFGFEPDVIFTAVNRCELSKAPWRNVDFFRAYLEAPKNQAKKALLIWLSRPKPLPTREQTERWSEWGWPVEHRSRDDGGDLRREEEVLWEMIRRHNEEGAGRFRILYINQFGWSREKLGALDPEETTFLDLRVGTDVEIGLSIYEPFGIAPLEPFSTGAVCVLSDSCGCAHHVRELQSRGFLSHHGFVVGSFTEREVEPSGIDLDRLAAIETEVYSEMIPELERKLRIPRADRLVEAQAAMSHLSWETAAGYLLQALNVNVTA